MHFKLLTRAAPIAINNKVQIVFDKFNFACVFFLDVKEAFDTVNQDFMHSKLSLYGKTDNEFPLLTSYLQVQRQYTSIKNISSRNVNTDYGVSQGFLLGLLLFLIY